TFTAATGTKRSFCPTCGSTLICWVDYDPGVIEVAAGTLDTPIDARIASHTFMRSKVSWHDIGDRAPQFATTKDAGEAPRAAERPVGRGPPREPGRACPSSERKAPQPEGVGDHGDAAEAHRRRGDRRAQEPPRDGVEGAGRDGDGERVVSERQDEVLPDVPER